MSNHSLTLDHIPILEGASNFPAWKKSITRTLQGEGFWGYVDGSDDVLAPFRKIPMPVATATSSPSVLKSYAEWWRKDAQARDIIERCISPVVSTIIPSADTTTARDVWTTLITLYGRIDITAQFDLRTHIANVKLKDHDHFDKYIGEFKTARSRFIAMGVTFTEADIVHLLIKNLPSTAAWPHFKQLLLQISQDHLDVIATAPAPLPPDTLLDRIVSRISIECFRLQSEANIEPSSPSPSTISSLAPSVSAPSISSIPTPSTFIRKHPKNPFGVQCSICNRTSHDRDHCFSRGGGREGQGPHYINNS